MIQTTFYNKNEAYVKLDQVSQLGRVFNAFATLGLEVESFSFGGAITWNWDTRFYRRYPENIIMRAVRKCDNGGELLWMNNRLYVTVDEYDVPLPMDIRSAYDNGVSFDIKFN